MLSDAAQLARAIAALASLADGDLDSPIPPMGNPETEPLMAGIERLRQRLLLQRQAVLAQEEEREQLLHNLAHEIRTPLTALENALDILASSLAEISIKESERLLGGARITATRVRLLTENLLSAGAIQAGLFQPVLQPMDLDQLFPAALEPLAAALEVRSQQVEVDIPTPCPVMGDPLYLGQALSNLVSNASKYGPEGSTIHVKAISEARTVRVEVTDHGPGISAGQQPGLFERYYRPSPSQATPSVGLGLAIVKGIIDAHRGSVGVISTPGNGNTVWFTLPVGTGTAPA